jgi:HEAT repeat protein
MLGKRSTRGLPLPTWWQICVVFGAAIGAWLLWSEHQQRAKMTPDSGRHDPGEKLRSVLDLSRQWPPAIVELTGLLQSEASDTRRNALLALAQLGPDAEESLSDIRRLFTDEDSSVRACALVAFSRVCDDHGQVLGVAAAFLADTDRRVRESAARMLETAGAASIPALIQMAHSDNPDAKQLVVRLLDSADRTRDPSDVNAILRSLLEDPDGATRLHAIHAVVGRGAAEIGEIRRWLRDDESKIVDEGLRALQSISPDTARPAFPELEALLDDTSGMRPLLFAALPHIGVARELIPALRKCADAPNCRHRFRIAQALVAVGAEPADVVPILIPLLSSPKEDYDNCWQAGQLLARM